VIRAASFHVEQLERAQKLHPTASIGGAGWKIEPEDFDRIEELLEWWRGKIKEEKGYLNL
jgi:hypothetical protein